MTDTNTASWEDALRDAYLEGRANVFLLHGAVGDFQCAGGEDGFVSLPEAVTDLLGRSRDFVVSLDGSGDGELHATAANTAVRSAFSWARPGTRDPSDVLRGNPIALMDALGRLLTTPAHPCGVIVRQAELLLGPHLDVISRSAVAKVRTWLDAPQMRQTNNVAVLIADHPDHLSPLLREHPRLFRIRVGSPSSALRVAALRGELGDKVAGASDDQLAAATHGLSLAAVAGLCSRLAAASAEDLLRLFPSEPQAPTGAPDPTDLPASPADVESHDV